MRRLLLVALTISAAAPLARAASPEHVYELVEEQRIDEAARELEPMLRARPHDPEVAFVDGDLLLQSRRSTRARPSASARR